MESRQYLGTVLSKTPFSPFSLIEPAVLDRFLIEKCPTTWDTLPSRHRALRRHGEAQTGRTGRNRLVHALATWLMVALDALTDLGPALGQCQCHPHGALHSSHSVACPDSDPGPNALQLGTLFGWGHTMIAVSWWAL